MMGRIRKWPEEIVDWLREHVPGRTTKEVADLINRQGFDKKYGMVFSGQAIKNAKQRYSILSGTPSGIPKGYSPKYPEGMEAFIRSIAEGRTTQEISQMVEERFGISFPENACRAYKKNHKIKSNLDYKFQKGHIPDNKGKKMSEQQYEKCKGTMFQKGNVPINQMRVGECTHTTDGYLIKKVQMQGSQRERFVFVHRETWEQHNGPVPAGKMIGFLDGNKDNCDISNLVLLDNQENLELNRSNLRFQDPEKTKVGLAIVKLNRSIHEKTKRRG